MKVNESKGERERRNNCIYLTELQEGRVGIVGSYEVHLPVLLFCSIWKPVTKKAKAISPMIVTW